MIQMGLVQTNSHANGVRALSTFELIITYHIAQENPLKDRTCPRLLPRGLKTTEYGCHDSCLKILLVRMLLGLF